MAPHDLRESLEASHGSPHRGGGEIGCSADWDNEGVRLVDSVVEGGSEIGNEDGQSLQGRASDVDVLGGNEGTMVLRQYQAAVTCDGRGEVLVVRGSDAKIGGQKACLGAWPREGSGFGPHIDLGLGLESRR